MFSFHGTYWEQNELLSHSQFGFRQKRSTSTTLIEFTDQILVSMDKGWVAGKSLAWFRSCLSGRFKQTICNDAFSPQANITMGVPQGSILEPLLFLVYINDIQSVLKHSKMTMFADDMAFHCHESCPIKTECGLGSDYILAKCQQVDIKCCKVDVRDHW